MKCFYFYISSKFFRLKIYVAVKSIYVWPFNQSLELQLAMTIGKVTKRLFKVFLCSSKYFYFFISFQIQTWSLFWDILILFFINHAKRLSRYIFFKFILSYTTLEEDLVFRPCSVKLPSFLIFFFHWKGHLLIILYTL